LKKLSAGRCCPAEQQGCRTNRHDKRKRHSFHLYLFASVLFFLFVTVSFASDLDESVSRIQKSYEFITDMKGSFVQKNVIRDLNKSDTYTGEFFIKRPLKMKWAYKGKAAQDLIISNDVALIFKKGDSQAYRSKFSKETHGQTPVALLTGMGNIRDEFFVTGDGNMLVLKPKKPMSNVVSITLMLTDADFPIRGFIIRDGRSNTVEIDLKDVRTNTGLKDSLFDLTLPKGVSVYEQQ
jgi:chaperone LolA